MTKVSIITVCYNAAKDIEKTILSVLGQDYKNIEYIIIDGNSNDGTKEIIEKYSSKITYWVSEPDKGIYDAMNKGIKAATGQWINFMNAGDTFVDDSIISRIGFDTIPESKLYIYGDNLDYHNDGTLSYYKAKSISYIHRGIICCHQSVFISTKFKDKIYYDTRYRICADYNQQLSLYKLCGRKGFHYYCYPISIYDVENGISAKARTLLHNEKLKIHIALRDITGIIFDVYYLCANFLKKLTGKSDE